MRERPFSTHVAYFLLTLLISVGFGVYLSAQRVTDPFLYYDVAFVKSLQHETKMVIPDSGPFASLEPVMGRQILMSEFANMMGIAPEVLQFMPIGAILVAITLYFLLLRLTKSPLLACLVTLYLTLNLSHAAALYSVFAYALAIPLCFGLILVAMRLFSLRGRLEILLMLLLFVGVHFIHYTISTWLILFLVGANGMIWLQRRLARNGRLIRAIPVFYLMTVFLVIFLAFNKTIYTSYLPLFGWEALDGAIQNFLSYISINPTLVNRSPYSFTRSIALGLIGTITLVLILTPVGIGILSDVWQLVKRVETRITDWRMPFIWGIFVIGVVDALSYAVRGSISTKTFSMLFPIVVMLYFQRWQKLPYVIAMAAVLLLTSFIKIGIFYQNAYVIGPHNLNTPMEAMLPSAEWLHTHQTKQDYPILADLNLYVKYLVASVDQPQTPIFVSYTESRFARVIGQSDEAWEVQPDVIAIDRVSVEPVVGYVWVRLAPLGSYEADIGDNQSLNFIYDDGAIWFTQPVAK